MRAGVPGAIADRVATTGDGRRSPCRADRRSRASGVPAGDDLLALADELEDDAVDRRAHRQAAGRRRGSSPAGRARSGAPRRSQVRSGEASSSALRLRDLRLGGLDGRRPPSRRRAAKWCRPSASCSARSRSDCGHLQRRLRAVEPRLRQGRPRPAPPRPPPRARAGCGRRGTAGAVGRIEATSVVSASTRSPTCTGRRSSRPATGAETRKTSRMRATPSSSTVTSSGPRSMAATSTATGCGISA